MPDDDPKDDAELAPVIPASTPRWNPPVDMRRYAARRYPDRVKARRSNYFTKLRAR
jgi:hypothetical protein